MSKLSTPSAPSSPSTPDRIVAAAFETLREEGFAGTSIRAIARRGGFNSALIFYYFGSLNSLLLASLDASSERRMARYRAAVAEADTLEEIVAVAARIYGEDVEDGAITVFSELIGGSLSEPELRPEIIARAEPWIDFVQEALDKILAGTAFEQILPSRDLAYAILAFYLGVNLFTHIDADRSRIEALFDLAARLAPLASPLLR